MNIKEFNQPTILKGTQYGTTVTIELDHSDTSIDEVMDGMLTIVKGLGYLDTTINQWIKDKCTDIYDDEHTIVKDSLADDWFDEKELPTECWCGSTDRCDCISEPNDNDEYNDFVESNWDEERIDIIGQNGNEGTHYEDTDINGIATDEDIEECDLNDTQLKDYKGVYVEKPTFDWDNGEDYNGQFKEWENETPDEDEFDDYGMKIPKANSIKMDKTKVRKGKIKDLKK